MSMRNETQSILEVLSFMREGCSHSLSVGEDSSNQPVPNPMGHDPGDEDPNAWS
jgi:hypothetical protein